MCSIQEEGETLPEVKLPNIRVSGRERKACMKCSKPAIILIREGDPFCSECFQSYCTHKFRASFGKSKLVRDGECVLMAFSGGPASCAMVHLIQEGLSKRAQKKLRFHPTLVYVDESAVSSKDETDLHHRTEIETLLKQSKLPYKISCIEKVMDLNTHTREADKASSTTVLSDSFENVSSCPENVTRIKDLFQITKSITAKESLLSTLRTRLLLSAAKEIDVNKVITGESSTRLATRMISGISQGQGAHIPHLMSFADKHYPDATILRPLREFTNKEIAVFNQLNRIVPVFLTSFNTKAGINSSLDSLTEAFVNGLQAEFPSTVSKICRAADKLDSADKSSVTAEGRCSMCQCPLDTDTGQCSALAATLFSGQLSNSGSIGPRPSHETFCYTCRIVAKELDCEDSLPVTVFGSTSLLSRPDMRTQIQDCLLDPDEAI